MFSCKELKNIFQFINCSTEISFELGIRFTQKKLLISNIIEPVVKVWLFFKNLDINL